MGVFSRKKKTLQEAELSTQEVENSEDETPRQGPWDSTEVEHIGHRLDVGSLWLPPIGGTELQFSVDQARNIVLAVVYVTKQSALQLQVFAAPKSESIWGEVRADVIASLAHQGGSSRDVEGEWGTEVRAQVPVPGTSHTTQPVRYLGIDGPRWLLRVALTGRAAVDEVTGDNLLHAVLDDLVVVRGNRPHPPRELLELSIPKSTEDKPEDADSLMKLPARGPEIQEVR